MDSKDKKVKRTKYRCCKCGMTLDLGKSQKYCIVCGGLMYDVTKAQAFYDKYESPFRGLF